MPLSPDQRARYPADWPARSRFVRLVRSRGLCEWCGARNGAPLPLRRPCCAAPDLELEPRYRCRCCGRAGPTVVLTAAHVHDRRPEAASLLNLAALCQRCHLAHDAPGRAARAAERRDAARGQPRLF